MRSFEKSFNFLLAWLHPAIWAFKRVAQFTHLEIPVFIEAAWVKNMLALHWESLWWAIYEIVAYLALRWLLDLGGILSSGAVDGSLFDLFILQYLSLGGIGCRQGSWCGGLNGFDVAHCLICLKLGVCDCPWGNLCSLVRDRNLTKLLLIHSRRRIIFCQNIHLLSFY